MQVERKASWAVASMVRMRDARGSSGGSFVYISQSRTNTRMQRVCGTPRELEGALLHDRFR